MTRIVERARSQSGETLVEALVSLLVIALVFMFLATCIVTVARINSSLENDEAAMVIAGDEGHSRVADMTGDAESAGTVKVVVSGEGAEVATVNVAPYREPCGQDDWYYGYSVQE